MIDAIQQCFRKYAVFEGRATRSEYWFFYLFDSILIYLTSYYAPTYVANFVDLAIFLPMLAVGVRRMHDVGKSGWFLLIPFYSLFLLCTPSADNNEYGSHSSPV